MKCIRNGKRCGHRKLYHGKDNHGGCFYMLDTGKSRNCPARGCKHFTTKHCRELSDNELSKSWRY